jgi:GAF domain-containing protein
MTPMEKEISSKLAKYDRLYEQIKTYIQTTEDVWARLATMEAVLHHKMQSFFWTGVYALIDGELIVRSYQGPVACQKLKHHVGVCWSAVLSGDTVIVEDVEQFPGHIACNCLSKSEIVIPIRNKSGDVFACLDVDSDQLGAFDREDEQGLKKILSLLYV